MNSHVGELRVQVRGTELFRSPTSSTFPRPEAFLRRLRSVNSLDVIKLPVSLVGVIRLCNVCTLPDISQYSEDHNCTFFPYSNFGI